MTSISLFQFSIGDIPGNWGRAVIARLFGKTIMDFFVAKLKHKHAQVRYQQLHNFVSSTAQNNYEFDDYVQFGNNIFIIIPKNIDPKS